MANLRTVHRIDGLQTSVLPGLVPPILQCVIVRRWKTAHMLLSNSGGGQEDEGGVGGSRTNVVFVQATRRVERDEEFFCKLRNRVPVSSGVSVTCVVVVLRRHVASLASVQSWYEIDILMV